MLGWGHLITPVLSPRRARAVRCPPDAPARCRGETTGVGRGVDRGVRRGAARRGSAGGDPSYDGRVTNDLALVPRPRLHDAQTVVAAPGAGPGYWAGGPSAVAAGGLIHLAYRLRRPVGTGRGYANVVASSRDGVHFDTVCVLERDAFGGRIPRAAGARPAPRWWLAHLRELRDAGHPPLVGRRHRRRRSRVVRCDAPHDGVGGDARTAVKDPVVKVVDGSWHAWPCVHEIADPATADRMHTAYCTSDDGLTWRWHGIALEGRTGEWDARGARVADVLWRDGSGTGADGVVAFYDGRATAEQNWEEVTGIATGAPGDLRAVGHEPELVSPDTGTGVRYVSVVELDGGARRFYYEVTRSDGAHDLRTEYSPAP